MCSTPELVHEPSRRSNEALARSIIKRIDTSIDATNTDAFNKIYDTDVWGSEGGGSGSGSDKNYAKAAGYIVQLILMKYGLRSMLDAPCGAVHSSWMSDAVISTQKAIPCFRYHGNSLFIALLFHAEYDEHFITKRSMY